MLAFHTLPLHKQEEPDQNVHSSVELKVNQNSSLFAHRFTNKNNKVVNAKLLWDLKHG